MTRHRHAPNRLRCLDCTSQVSGQGLTFRWGNPLSLALYGVVYASDAIPHAACIARQLANDRDAASIEALVREIELELAEPTRNAAEILPMAAPQSDEHLRELLRLVAEHLREATVR